MRCEVLRPFAWSADGFTGQSVSVGSVVDLPDEMVAGLEREGFVREHLPAQVLDTQPADEKGLPAAPENAAMEAAPENKMEKRRGRR